jgi:Ca2+/Na+ antiporter
LEKRKIYRRLFYLNTGSKTAPQPTIALSCNEAFFVLGICSILKKTFLPTLHISFPFFFSLFFILSFTIDYFNHKLHKSQNNVFTKEWKNETSKTKMLYRICNIVLIISLFSILIYILEYLDN